MSEASIRPWANRWGICAEDYERFRPGPPPSYYDILAGLGCGLPGQNVLDLGTGPGLLACELARRGANVQGIDRSTDQIRLARARAARLGVDVTFSVAKIEDIPALPRPLDLAIANMAWQYFDQPWLLDWLLRGLGDRGLLAISRFNAIYSHPLVQLAEEALRSFGVERGPRKPPGPSSRPRFVSDPRFHLHALVYYEEPIRFSIDAWVGRWRASQAVVRWLPPEQTDAFSEHLRARLEAHVTDPFEVPHFVNLEVYAPDRAAQAGRT
jgi:SAM-dependent methyltransferase